MPLTPEQLAVVANCVDALVAHDQSRLSDLVADGRDIYTWTRDYGSLGDVDLVTPAGDPTEWEIDAVQVTAASQPTISAQVAMWTAQEGRSDLTLQLTLTLADHGHWTATIDDLHVL